MRVPTMMRAVTLLCSFFAAGAHVAHAQVFRSSVDMVGLTVTVTDARAGDHGPHP